MPRSPSFFSISFFCQKLGKLALGQVIHLDFGWDNHQSV